MKLFEFSDTINLNEMLKKVFLNYVFLILFSIRVNNGFEYEMLKNPDSIKGSYSAFSQSDEESYLEAFDTLIKDSYSVPLPSDLKAECTNQNHDYTTLTVKTITTSMSSSDLQIFCGYDSICTISSGLSVNMNSNLNVAALVVMGNLLWNEVTQPSNTQWLCAGKNFNLKKKFKYFFFFCFRLHCGKPPIFIKIK